MNSENLNSKSETPQRSQLAAAAVELLRKCAAGTLATQSMKHPGFPFASLMPYSVSDANEPIFLISGLATHTRNLNKDSKASLLVLTSDPSENPTGGLSQARLTLMGNVKPVGSEKVKRLSAGYLERHPSSSQWVGFGDFEFYRLEIVDAYFVAGFGAMGWIKPAEFSVENLPRKQGL